MTDFKVKDTVRVTNLERRLSTTRVAIKARDRQVIQILGDEGPQRLGYLAEKIGFSHPAGAFPPLKKLIQKGVIQSTGGYYHLPGQSIEGVKHVPQRKQPKDFFEGDRKVYELRRWIRDHQDEPTTIQHMADVCGYATGVTVGNIVNRLIHQGTLRRYRAPEDRGYEWRYQYVPDELSGVKTTKPADVAQEATDWADEVVPTAPEAVLHEEPMLEPTDEQRELVEEIKEDVERILDGDEENQKAREDLRFARLVEEYAKEFYWATGSTNVRDLVIWLKERALAGLK